VDHELPQPDRDRVSTLTALLLLTYTLIRIVTLPSYEAEFTLLGLLIRLELNASFVMLTIAALLAAAGSDWLIRSHPAVKDGGIRPEHWVIPGLAALGTGAILIRIPEGPGLWIGLILTAALLVAVLMSEFIVLDPEDPRHDTAAIGLTALAYLLLVGALFVIRATGLRAAFAIPLPPIACGAVAWRLLRLARIRTFAFRYALLISGITAQIAWGLHYWPLPPLRGALLLGLIVYLGNGLALAHEGGMLERIRIIEFAVVGVIGIAAVLMLT
jgi:hypothetical protein